MIGCLRTRVRKQPIIALYFESETVLKFYSLEAWVTEDASMTTTLSYLPKLKAPGKKDMARIGGSYHMTSRLGVK